MNDEINAILHEARDLESWLIATRRELHRIPESGNEEYKTSDALRIALDQMNIAYTHVGTGIIAVLRGAYPGKCVALRADMDALPIEEPQNRPYSSLHPGFMHACGHDAHMTVALGAAKLLAKHRDEIHGSIKFFFQPAEESTGGAKPMIEAECLENPHVDYVLGLHVAPELPVGQAEFKIGAFYGASDNLEIIVKGRSAHAAHPEQGIDAICVSAQIIQALQTIITRSISALESAVITIGKIQGGTRSNVLAPEVVLTGTIRTLSEEIRDFIHEKITYLCKTIAEASGAVCEVNIRPSYPVLINQKETTEFVRSIASQILGTENVHDAENPTLGVEDFAYFLRERPGTFWHLGCAPRGVDSILPLHSSVFDIDETCLVYGVAVQTASALQLLEASDTASLPAAGLCTKIHS